MSALPSGTGVAARLAPEKPKTQGYLHIARYGGGPRAVYMVTYRRLERDGRSASPGGGAHSQPVLAEDAQALLEFLERIGVDFHLKEVRDALEDILRLGSANIPDLWLGDEEMLEKGFVAG